MTGDAAAPGHMDSGATRHDDSGSIIAPPSEAGADNTPAEAGTVAPVDGGAPVVDATAPPVDAAPPVTDGGAPGLDSSIFSSACLSAGGTCIPVGNQCPGSTNPALGCGDPSMETCCVPNLFVDGGFDAALGVDCLLAGGSCQLATAACPGGLITTASCGDMATWACCGGVYDAGVMFDASFLFDSGL